jgi:hypothetical protein
MPVDTYVIKFEGGMADGLMAYQTGWPPPEFFSVMDDDDREHVYERAQMSQLPDDVADHPNLMRGAVYKFKEVLDASTDRESGK